MTACAKLTASASAPRRPSRTSRRQVNNWPADNPYLRAVADTRRGALALSATIRRFSSGVQRRRAPVSITSSRDTFDIVVCSVIRLCLRGFIPQRKAAVAGGLRFEEQLVDVFSRNHRADKFGRVNPRVGVRFVKCTAPRDVRLIAVDERPAVVLLAWCAGQPLSTQLDGLRCGMPRDQPALYRHSLWFSSGFPE